MLKTRSLKQQKQSRLNGQRSKGPLTLKGKHKVSGNALKHGVLAKRHAPHGEESDLVEQHREELEAIVQPTCAAERRLVAELALDVVKGTRLASYLDAAQNLQLDELADEDQDLRGRLRELRSLQADWERIVHQLSRDTGDNLPERVKQLVSRTAALEGDPAAADAAYRALPSAMETETAARDYGRLLQPGDVRKRLEPLATEQLKRVRQMVNDLLQRISFRQACRTEMASAVPTPKAVALADRYSRMISRNISSRLELLRELRELRGPSPRHPLKLVKPKDGESRWAS